MTRIVDLLGDGPTVSFEFFPPKTEEGKRHLDECIEALSTVDPTFVSVTYGAGGSTRENTREVVVEIADRRPFPAMPHLTCMGHARADLASMLDDYAAAGVQNVLALAGDPPADGSPSDGEFNYASELVALARAHGEFSIGVAAFPEGHPRSTSAVDDRRWLAEKLTLADFGITQFFFRAEDYLRMRDDLARLGCETPVIPGIMPMLNPTAIRRFASMNGASFPEELAAAVDTAAPGDRQAIAVAAASDLSAQLLAEGVPGLHLYCLNRAEASLEILAAVLPERVGPAGSAA